MKEFLKTQSLIYWSLFLGSVITLVGAVYLVSQRIILPMQETTDLTMIVICILCSVAVLTGTLMAKSTNIKLSREEFNADVLRRYLNLFLIRIGLLEFAALSSTIALVLTADLNYSYIAFAMILLMRLNKPSVDKLLMDLQVSEIDLNKFLDAKENH